MNYDLDKLIRDEETVPGPAQLPKLPTPQPDRASVHLDGYITDLSYVPGPTGRPMFVVGYWESGRHVRVTVFGRIRVAAQNFTRFGMDEIQLSMQLMPGAKGAWGKFQFTMEHRDTQPPEMT